LMQMWLFLVHLTILAASGVQVPEWVRAGFVAQIGLRSYFPLNRTDLAYGLCLGDAKRCEAV
jgi:hypothetical protein